MADDAHSPLTGAALIRDQVRRLPDAPFPYLAEQARDWIAQAKGQGASHIVTLYHSCHRQIVLIQASFPEDEQIEVVNYLTLIARSLGLPERDDNFARFAKSGDIDAMMEELQPRIATMGLDPARARASLTAHFSRAAK